MHSRERQSSEKKSWGSNFSAYVCEFTLRSKKIFGLIKTTVTLIVCLNKIKYKENSNRQTDSLLVFKEQIKNILTFRKPFKFYVFIEKLVQLFILTGYILIAMYVTLKCTSCTKISFIIIIMI